MTPYYQADGITLYRARCEDVLPQISPRGVVLLTDPPWGSQTRVDNARFSGGERARQRGHDFLQPRQPLVNDEAPFDPAPLLRFPRCILWGANWYASRLPDSGGWFVWDKRKGIEETQWPLSEAELAWTNIGQGIRVFRHRWVGLLRETERGEHYHPTQKPIALMRWCLERAGGRARVGMVLDPYAGVGSTLLAARELGIPVIGCEIDDAYCHIIVQRLRQGILPLWEAPLDAEEGVC